MSEKRKRHDDKAGAEKLSSAKRPRKGFTVGPANLPDGTYRRKTIKIKQGLIDKAKIKKDYAKLKKQGNVGLEEESIPQPASLLVEGNEVVAYGNATSDEPHPDRQILIEEAAEGREEPIQERVRQRQPRKRKAEPFKKEYEEAQARKQEAEERRKAREQAEQERQRKMEERERFRRAMAKARTGGRNGQRKLGRESNVLLEKVKRMVGEGD